MRRPRFTPVLCTAIVGWILIDEEPDLVHPLKTSMLARARLDLINRQ
ncbi:MAG: hypothetical protein U0996_16225 [Planctomycetaceae bacterium]